VQGFYRECYTFLRFANFYTLLHTFILYCILFPQRTPWMSGTCMDSILQPRSNLSHPASYCCKCARYDFPSTVVSRMPGICMDSIMQIHSNLSHPASHCFKCARYDFPSTVLSRMPGICMDSIMQIHSNLSHPASHCSKCARYDFPSTVLTTQ
jgi:hypothetical protein